MDRKLKELIKPDENAMLDAVCASAHQIWQAGLGAFARAQQEGGDLFDKLVQEGGELQKLTQPLIGEKGFSIADTVAKLAGHAGRQAGGSWDKLEKIFEERVSRSLRSLGVPAATELRALGSEVADMKAALQATAQRTQGDIDALRQAIAELQAAAARGAQRPAVKTAVTRPAAKAAAAAPAAKRPAAKRTAGPASRAS